MPKDDKPHQAELWIDGVKFQGTIHSMAINVNALHVPLVHDYLPWADQFSFGGQRYGRLDITFDLPAEVTYAGMVDTFLSRLPG